MAEVNEVLEEKVVACEICLKEIPVSEARSREASDYFVYFCGAECHKTWEEQRSGEVRGG